jgi:hypothetical protein
MHHHAPGAGGRTLLTLDAHAGDRAEGLYRSMGWNRVGLIPGYALKRDGTLFFWNGPPCGSSAMQVDADQLKTGLAPMNVESGPLC